MSNCCATFCHCIVENCTHVYDMSDDNDNSNNYERQAGIDRKNRWGSGSLFYFRTFFLCQWIACVVLCCVCPFSFLSTFVSVRLLLLLLLGICRFCHWRYTILHLVVYFACVISRRDFILQYNLCVLYVCVRVYTYRIHILLHKLQALVTYTHTSIYTV